MFRIQYLSDIHLETRKNTNFNSLLKPSANYLALCGDIGYSDIDIFLCFLEYCSVNFKEVFYVPGNHEFYNHQSRIKFKKYKSQIKNECNDLQKFKELEEKYRIETKEEKNKILLNICNQFKNIHYMDKAVFKIPETDVIIIGCTLWTNLLSNFEMEYYNDFKKIYETSEQTLTIKTYNEWNNEDILFLKKSILENKNKNNKIIVLTHHCPTDEVILDKYKVNAGSNNCFFSNQNLITEMGDEIKLWLCGHTHGCKKIKINNTIVATNTLGYEGEKIEGFLVDAVIEI